MSPYPSRRQWLRKKGLPTYRLIRYADDFVILVKGTREQAEGLKQETAEFLRQHLRMELSQEKTLVTHAEGFVFLGHRIQQVRVDGREVLRTFPSKGSLQRVKEKVKRLTARSTIHLSLEQLLGTLNPVLRGWSNYFRFDAAKRTLAYLDHYTWWRVYHWLRKRHPRVSARKLKDRLFSDWVFREGDTELFRPSRVRVERYQFKGSKILHRWNQHLGLTERRKHRELAFDDNAFLETISNLL